MSQIRYAPTDPTFEAVKKKKRIKNDETVNT